MKRVLFKVISIIMVLIIIVGISVAICLLFASCNGIGEHGEFQSCGDRFVILNREWHRGYEWRVVLDTKTDEQYLWVGGTMPIPME